MFTESGPLSRCGSKRRIFIAVSSPPADQFSDSKIVSCEVSTSRRPSVLTPTVTMTATETMW